MIGGKRLRGDLGSELADGRRPIGPDDGNGRGAKFVGVRGGCGKGEPGESDKKKTAAGHRPSCC
jgi:hypothetical protein